ncbi:MAG: YhgE/Pip domain-containing protein, partial [Eubacteriales bacterium]|nr:YhgE/Pip domain-containing protein [Eubacteriales bacterium]
IRNVLTNTDKSLEQYEATINSFINSLDAIKSMIDTTKLVLPIATGTTENGANISNNINALLHSTGSVSDGLNVLLSNYVSKTDSSIQDILMSWQNIQDISGNIKDATFDELDIINREIQIINNRLNEFYNTNEKIADTLRRINSALPIKLSGLENMANKLSSINKVYIEAKDVGKNIEQILNTGEELSEELRNNFSNKIGSIRKDFYDLRDIYDIEVKPQLDTLAEENYRMLNNIYLLMKNTQNGIYQINEILDSSYKSLESAGKALQETNKAIDLTKGNINNLKEDVNQVENNIKSDQLATILSNDPELMATFISAPVDIENFSFYPIKNYGSAMTPFYTTLALWVGGVILVSLLKVRVYEDEEIKNIKHYQSYFGRYLLFMCLGTIQALIVCLGDLYFLKVQCLNPALFILSGVITSFIFTNIIYTLTVSFGDVGKALCVFLLVIQIGGSGGTFPIEVTPQFFQNVYPILPFTHAINAMRETIAGIFENNFYKYIINLLRFLPFSLILGVLLRVPLIKLNNYFEEKLEETHLI